MARTPKTKKTSKTTSPSPSHPFDVRNLLVALACGFGAYLAVSRGVLFTGGTWQIPLFMGCVVGLSGLATAYAASTAAGIMLVSMALLPPGLPFAAKVGPLDLVLAAAIAASTSALLSYLSTTMDARARKRLTLVASVLMVLWVLVNLWLPLFATGLPVRGYGPLNAAQLAEVPQPGKYHYDDEVYRRVYYLMHQGKPYYAAFREAWFGQEVRPPAISVPMGYRLPTIFWLWRLLPAYSFSIVYLYLAMCSMGLVSAALISGQIAGARYAPLAAAAMAAYVMSIGYTSLVTFVDLPAMSIALVGIALFARATVKHSRGALWGAAAAVALAALTREILVYVAVLAALSSLLEPAGKRLKAALPWLAALGVFAVGYSAHVVAVLPLLEPSTGQMSYTHGGIDFVLSGVTYYAYAFNGFGYASGALFLAGVVGAYAAHRSTGWPFAGFATAALVLPMVAMLRIGNPAIVAGGGHVNYWGMLVVPLALALWPVWVLLVQRKRPS